MDGDPHYNGGLCTDSGPWPSLPLSWLTFRARLTGCRLRDFLLGGGLEQEGLNCAQAPFLGHFTYYMLPLCLASSDAVDLGQAGAGCA